MSKKIESILIVGGGSSGWMTAAAIVKQLPNIKCTLVESSNVPTIGVGESTIGHINQFFHLLGLKDEDWMPHCDATYKTSIKFIDFRENPSEEAHKFHYPFGLFEFTDKPRGVMDWFICKLRNKDIDPSNFAEFYHDNILMSDAGKMTKNENNELRAFNFWLDTAYHMNAGLFGEYLKNFVCKPAGMTHIVDTVTGYELDAEGNIAHINTERSGKLTADLYVDCTGFKSILLEQAMGVRFIDFKDVLFNDSAIATVIPYIDKEKEMQCYTSCTAIETGWVWYIPLFSRIGTGYVYSSRFATKEQAEAQFRKQLKSNRMICPDDARADAAEFRHISIKHGVHERTWEKNVIGIGLSNGFIEPLESTGLMLTHEAIIKMVAALRMRDGVVTKYDIDLFNHALREQVLGFKEFISQHYALSMRDDTPYWQAITANNFSKPMNDYVPSLYNQHPDLAMRLHRSRSFSTDMSGIIYIAAGMGYNPLDDAHNQYLDRKYREKPGYDVEVYNKWLEHKKEVMGRIEKMPSHYEFLRQHIHKNNQP
jgi:tryptophan halogenase